MTGRTWDLALPSGIAPVSANKRIHWRQRYQTQLVWKLQAFTAVVDAGVPRLERVRLELQVTPPDRARRDPDNLVDYLLKPIKDGVVEAGVVPDDTAEFVDCLMPVLVDPDGTKRWRYRLLLTDLSGAPPDGTSAPDPQPAEPALLRPPESHPRNSEPSFDEPSTTGGGA